MAGMSTLKPVIGVTSYRERAAMGVWDTEAVFLPVSYANALWSAGATVVVLPPQAADPDNAADVVSRLDGLAISGGYDVDPARYGASAHPLSDEPRPFRDEWEIALLNAACEIDMPILGVCRGAQVLNVARGGTLIQHLPDVVGSTRHQGSHGVFASVGVTVDQGTLLSRFHDAAADVPVYHHQAIDSLGAGLTVCARSDDGVIEAIEDPSLSFCIATQWHPEQDPGSERLYEAFILAAATFASARSAS